MQLQSAIQQRIFAADLQFFERVRLERVQAAECVQAIWILCDLLRRQSFSVRTCSYSFSTGARLALPQVYATDATQRALDSHGEQRNHSACVDPRRVGIVGNKRRCLRAEQMLVIVDDGRLRSERLVENQTEDKNRAEVRSHGALREMSLGIPVYVR